MSEGTSSRRLVRSSPSRYYYYYDNDKDKDCTGRGDRADGGWYPPRVRAPPLASSVVVFVFFVFVFVVFVFNDDGGDDGEDCEDGGESRTVRCGGHARTLRFDNRPLAMEGPRRHPRLFLRRRSRQLFL